MNLLTATTATQGVRDNDFDFAVEGELVWVGFVCARDERNPSRGGCGCGRSFGGLNSHRATTTARVRDLAMTRSDVLTAYAGYLESAGYGTFDEDDLAEDVDAMIAVCATWPEGAIIERRLDLLTVRGLVAS